MGKLENVASACHVDVGNPERIFEIVLDTDDRGQVEDRVDTGRQRSFEGTDISDIARHEPEVGVSVKVDTAVAGVVLEIEKPGRSSTGQQSGSQDRIDEGRTPLPTAT